MRICIITSGPIGSDPRVVKEADALSEAGHNVTVVAVRTLPAVDRLDDAILAGAIWQSQRLDFRSRGNRWRLLRLAQVSQVAAFSLTRSGRLAERAISTFTPALCKAAKSIAADIYIAHYPGALPAAAIAAHANNARYAYDAEDYHLGDWINAPQFERNRRLVRAVESNYLSNCAYVTAAAPGIADAYAKAYGIPLPTTVLNVFPRAQAPAAPSPAGTAVPGPSVYWFSQTIGSNRGLEVAVEAIGRARTKPHLYLRGSPQAGFLEMLSVIAAKFDAADRIHFLTPELSSAMPRLASIYDVGLSSEPGCTLNNTLALGNKVFTYLLGGIPSLLSSTPAHVALVGDLGHAARSYKVEDANSLANAMDELIGNAETLAVARSAAFHLGQARFNWDVEKTKLLECIMSA